MDAVGPPLIAVALGRIRYGLAVFVIGFGVFFGWSLMCAVPFCIAASYADKTVSPALGLSSLAAWLLLSSGLTYRSRHLIHRKAAEDVSAAPVQLWRREQVGTAVVQSIAALLVIPLTIIAVAVALALAYGAYLLLASVSTPIATLIGAAVIAAGILVAASA